VTDRFVDREYLTGVQYASDANLSARQAIYRFQQPRIRNSEWTVDRAGLRGDERVLDLGCGNGLHLAELARRRHRGAVVGADLSTGMLSAAAARSAAALLVADAQQLPFGDDVFDCVLAMHMLYHVPDRDVALAEIRRVLCPGGVMLAVTNSYRHLEELNQMIDASRAYLTFSAESGGAELVRHFASVERHDVQSELVVTEVEPVVAYVASMVAVTGVADNAASPWLEEVERKVRAEIEARGAFRIRTDVACFVCR
jgi:ubiquinone/menaquinone biosynthesis C-methylase UbiE